MIRRPPISPLFPYPPLFRFVSADEFIYTADGKIKRRSLENHSVRNIEFTASLSFTRHAYKQNQRDFDSTVSRKVTDRKSTRLNSSHGYISYAVFCLKKKQHN